MKTKSLHSGIKEIIRNKGTEIPFTGEYTNKKDLGTYLCRQCGLALFRSQTKFDSGCGWPSFDEEIPGTVKNVPDADGKRTEIVCARCQAHLGHVFKGEGFTKKNIRHCANSTSLDFVPDAQVLDTQEGIYAAGCFWGVESYFKKLPGVLKTEVGYIGGSTNNPTYESICSGQTGYFEAIRVVYDLKKLDYEKVTKYFFEIHDPTQADGQGPDIGSQYLSAIFYYSEEQRKMAQNVKDQLTHQGLSITTQILPATSFWKAEEYHQNYYEKTGKQPYCHTYVKRFT